MKEKNFISRFYTAFGVIGSALSALNILLIILMRNGIVRAEFHLFFFIVLPNFIAKLFLALWAFHYTRRGLVGRDINSFAKAILGLVIANIVVVAADESTVTYYLVQAFTNLMIAIFLSNLISQRSYAARNKKYASFGFVSSMFIYLSMILTVFLIAISFTSYDPYLVTLTVISHICTAVSFVLVGIVEKKYVIVIRESMKDD